MTNAEQPLAALRWILLTRTGVSDGTNNATGGRILEPHNFIEGE